MQVRRVTDGDDEVVAEMAEVLRDCVADGASVGYVDVPMPAEAVRFWRAEIANPASMVWVALADGSGSEVLGTVQLLLATEANGTHRAQIAKLLVHRSARARGVGTALMSAAERAAVLDGRRLLLLDTQTGSRAEALYRRLGWEPIGTVTEYASSPDGTLEPTTFMIKRLLPGSSNPS